METKANYWIVLTYLLISLCILALLFSEIKIWVPDLDNSELPALWWDAISDKCLLLGVFKHGKIFDILFVSSFIYLLQVAEKYVVICKSFSALLCLCVIMLLKILKLQLINLIEMAFKQIYLTFLCVHLQKIIFPIFLFPNAFIYFLILM